MGARRDKVCLPISCDPKFVLVLLALIFATGHTFNSPRCLLPPRHRHAAHRPNTNDSPSATAFREKRNPVPFLVLLFDSPDPTDEDPVNVGAGNNGPPISGLQTDGMKTTIEPGDTVICKREIASMGIYENEGYELRSIYAQKFDPQNNRVDKVPLVNLDEIPPSGYERYVTLYSPVHHDEGRPVVATPEEVGLVSVRSEVLDSMSLAIPGLFWLFLCYTFVRIYHERTGGNFFDAFWGR